jgi:hypothetical protein
MTKNLGPLDILVDQGTNIYFPKILMIENHHSLSLQRRSEKAQWACMADRGRVFENENGLVISESQVEHCLLLNADTSSMAVAIYSTCQSLKITSSTALLG